MTPEESAVLEISQEARFLKSKLEPYFKAIEERTIAEMKIQFRGQKIEGHELQVRVGMLCAIEDLKNLLVRQIVNGQALESKMIADKPMKEEFDPYD